GVVAGNRSAGDFFARPLVGGLVAVVAPPQALVATVTSVAIATAALRARTRRMRFIKIIPPRGRPRSRSSQESWFAGGMEAVCSSCGDSPKRTTTGGLTRAGSWNNERRLKCDDVVQNV